MSTEFTAILLAGGRSARMGRDKAMLDWHGGPLIEHMIDRLQAAGACVRVSGDRPMHRGVPDAVPGGGPVTGIASVVPHCPDGEVLAVPVDMPLLAVARIHALRAALAMHPAAHFEGHPLPCAFRLDGDMRARIAASQSSAFAGVAVHVLLARLGAVALPVGDGADLRPCNTPSDYAALVR